jgi:hypothetical protein
MSSEQVKAPTKTLTPTSETTKTYETSDTGMSIRSPYKDWDPDRMFISPPDKKESGDKKAVYYECPIQYNYKLPDGSEMKGPLLIEFPHEDGKLCVSDYGVSEILEKLDEKEKSQQQDGESVQRKGTNKFQIFCKLDPRHEQSQELAAVLNDIYDKSLSHMEEHGSEGTNMLVPGKKYSKGKEPISESNVADHLRYPIWYKETTIIGQGGRTKTVNDTKVPFSIVLSVVIKGRKATKFCDEHANVIKFIDLVGVGMEHIPLMHVSSIFVGTGGGKLRLTTDSSIVVKKLPPAIVHQGSTIKERMGAGKSAKSEMTRLAEEAFAKEGLNSKTTQPAESNPEKANNERKLEKSSSAERSPRRGSQQSPPRTRDDGADRPRANAPAPRKAGQRAAS